MNLIKNNADVKKRFEVKAASDGQSATVYLYDLIDPWWGINAEDFANELNSIDAKTINLRVNSPGGDVMEARAIYTALKQHPARVVAHVDGLAASAATFICMAADEIRMTDGAFFMIHKGWSVAIGNADDMRASADLLDKVDKSIVADYHRKTGVKAETLIEWMSAETWLDAAEALAHGFIDYIDGEEGASNSAPRTAYNLSTYKNTPAALTNAPPPDDTADKMAALRAKNEARLNFYEMNLA